jgi:hypothetical protein
MTPWQTISRPGYFGRHRDERYAEYDLLYGPGCWRIVWQIGDFIGDVAAATMLYEDAYLAFLSSNTGVLATLVAEARDVYDDALTNIESRFDYAAQETNRTHLQDIAIRRCLVRLGRWFEGPELVQIRDSIGINPLSLTLSPGRVVFHRPDLIIQPELEGWWEAGSIESFYQSNKLLQAM